MFNKPQADQSSESSNTKTQHKPNKKPANHNKIIKTSQKNIISRVLSGLIGENVELAKYWRVVKQIEAFDERMQALSNNELKAKTVEFREQLVGLKDKELEKKLDDLLPEAFAVVREASYRTIGKKQFPVQLIGGMVLHSGRVAEMKTGEGKTYVAPLAAYLNALPEKSQVHVVTVNDYLARVGASEIGEIFEFLGLSVGVVQPNSSFYFKLGYQDDDQSETKREIGRVDDLVDGVIEDNRSVVDVKNLVPCDRKRAYELEDGQFVDIVYAVNSELGFDYLRDNMVQSPLEVAQKAGHTLAIIDEVDSILIDEARTPLIISSEDESSSNRYKQFSKIASTLNKDLDYTVDEKRKVVSLTDLGIEKIERTLNINNLYLDPTNVVLIHHLDQALKAKALFHHEKEYVVRDNEIIIVDEFTGRLMYGRRYSQGLHQALEAKEDIKVQAESKTVATITYQNFFRLYKKLSGMTGTASTESEELYKIYKLLVVTVPTNRPMVRKDQVDKIYKTENGKFTDLVRDVVKIHELGQPILIGTTSIDKNLALSAALKKAGVQHELLNAKNHEQEARIISNAGRKNSVTLATNIAGRGVDIVLGGHQPEDEEDKKQWRVDHDEVVSLGGLYVMGTERHESRRIDNQLRGRAGRQGDPGSSRFYVSFDDYILRVFGGDKVSYYANILPVAEDEAIEYSSMAWLIEQAQKKIEGQNFDARKYVTEYDDVINKQRTVVYSKRKKVLLNENFDHKYEIEASLYREVERALKQVEKPTKRNSSKDEIYQTNLERASSDLRSIYDLPEFEKQNLELSLKKQNYKPTKLAKDFHKLILDKLNENWVTYTEKDRSAMTRFGFLRSIDTLWTEHLVTIDHLQDSTKLRYIAQKDPLTEFKEEGMSLFTSLLKEIDREVAITIFKISPSVLPVGIA